MEVEAEAEVEAAVVIVAAEVVVGVAIVPAVMKMLIAVTAPKVKVTSKYKRAKRVPK